MRVPVLPRHQAARLAWAIRHLRFTRADWANVLFVDETKIKLSDSDGRLGVYRRTGERARNNCVLKPNNSEGALSLYGQNMYTQTQIVRVNGNLNDRRYQTDIITPLLLPHFSANRGIIVAQDNAPCHAARTKQQMLLANNVRILP